MNLVKKYLNPKNDAAFKRIFGTEKNKDILIAMLNAVLGKRLHKRIEQIQFLSPRQEPELVGSKESVVDVLCQDNDGCQYIIEMQIGHAEGFENRAQYYAAKAFVNQARVGDKYADLKRVIFIAFCDFNIFSEKEHYKSEHFMLDGKTNERNLTQFSFTFIDLVKFDKQRAKSVKDLTLEEKFYYFLCHAEDIEEEELKKLIANKTIKKAFTELTQFNWSGNDFAYYESAEKKRKDYISTLDYSKQEGIKIGEKKGEKRGKQKGIKIGEKRGEQRGIEIGAQKERRKMVEQLLASGMNKPRVGEILGLTLPELEKLLNFTA